MSQSDIFNRYAKIAIAQGLVSEGKDSTERLSQQQKKELEELYNVVPESIDNTKTIKDLVEKAHPKKVVVSPAHDKINGLVENIFERQDILMYLVKKTPHGQLGRAKIATEQLTLDLIKVANYLDNTDQEELRILADSCLDQVSAIRKEAWVAPLVYIGAGLLTSIWLVNKFDSTIKNISVNGEDVIESIDQLIDDSGFFDDTLKTSFKDNLDKLRTSTAKLIDSYEKNYPLIESVTQLRTGSELREAVNNMQNAKITRAKDLLLKDFEEHIPVISAAINNLNKDSYRAQQIEDPNWVSRWLGNAGDALVSSITGKWGFFSDQYTVLLQKLRPFYKSLTDARRLVSAAKSFSDRASQALEASVAEEDAADKKSAEQEGKEDADKALEQFSRA